MWDVVVRSELRPMIDRLRGKKTSYGDVIKQLERDPCVA